jgi:prevent-host-death family protein
MAITKLSSREFNQDTSRAKRAAKRGPVFITDRGHPSHVLLTAEEYERITGGQKSIAALLAMRSVEDRPGVTLPNPWPAQNPEDARHNNLNMVTT